MPAHHWGSPKRSRPRGCARSVEVPDPPSSQEGGCCRDVVLSAPSGPTERDAAGVRARNVGTREELILGPSSLGFLRAFTGKQYRRCGVLRERAWEVQVLTLSEPRLRMLLAGDSGTVVMKVDIRSGVCNNSPAQASSSENE